MPLGFEQTDGKKMLSSCVIGEKSRYTEALHFSVCPGKNLLYRGVKMVVEGIPIMTYNDRNDFWPFLLYCDAVIHLLYRFRVILRVSL